MALSRFECWQYGQINLILQNVYIIVHFFENTPRALRDPFAGFTALLDIGTLIGGPLFGAIIDTAGWEPMFVVAGVGLGAATVVFARWDRLATSGTESEPATADRV